MTLLIKFRPLEKRFVVVLRQKLSFERIQKLSMQEAKHDAKEGQFKMLQCILLV